MTLKHDGRAVETFVVYPEVKDKAPVVLIIHEIFGMTDWVQDLADQVAEAGYIAVAPDLLSGMGPNGGRSTSFPPGEGMSSAAAEAVSHLNPDQITADLDAAADYANYDSGLERQALCGGILLGWRAEFPFCHSSQGSCRRVRFLRSAPAKDAMAAITAPIYGFYAGNDSRIGATLPDTREQMKAAGKTFEPVVYEGAGHGFMRAGEAPDASDANRQAREQAWARWKELLAKGQ